MTNDPISDFIVRIKNAGMSKLSSVVVPHSKLKESIATLLEKEGYVANVSVNGKKESKRTISLDLVYDEDGQPRVHQVRRISKPSRRIYAGKADLQTDREGMTVISTSKGVTSLREARETGLGGEVLFKVR